jgi:hypothetical protein
VCSSFLCVSLSQERHGSISSIASDGSLNGDAARPTGAGPADSSERARSRSSAAFAIGDGECSFIYRYISRESCSQFDSLPLTSLTIALDRRARARRRGLASRRFIVLLPLLRRTAHGDGAV